MKTQLERVEIQAAALCNHDFTIEHATGRQLRAQRFDQLRKVAIQWFLIAALNLDFVSITKDQGAKTVPLGLENPVSLNRQIVHSLGEHRQYRRIDSQVHALLYLGVGPVANLS